MNKEIIASLPLPKQNLAVSLCRASDGLQDLRGRYGCEHWTIEKSVHRRIDAFKLWCLKTLESPLDSKEIKPVNLKGNKPYIFIERTDSEAKTPMPWPSDAKN